MNRVALIMAGGTGGHVFPALALALALREQGWQVAWLGTRRGMEVTWVSAHQFPMEYVHMTGVRGRGWKSLLVSPFKLIWAVGKALSILMKWRPHVIIGFGGYAALPGGIAAVLLRLPLVIHEQNAVAGLTNRVLARLANTVLEGFPGAFAAPAQGLLVRWLGQPRHLLTVGNPVREALRHLAPPAQRFAQRVGNLRILVLGGSQGAQALNHWVPQALSRIPVAERPMVIHQAGQQHLDQLTQHYRQLGLEGDLRAFIDDMAAVYAVCDLVICRAGALTIAELMAVGLGSVLVPFPAAVDDHQTRNARFLEAAGAARLWPQQEADAQQLADWLGQQTRSGLLVMAEAARRLAPLDTVAHMVRTCEEWAA
ncbi:MAG: undecaprenyldiphospho-muramoylpentapeptide beta-N-acetylglucosaminyltransferase [Betaproteobacteria bacterium]|jgi:UDP-N-acetylglucosamine--N-acetylmuramyl-(pentapeptide) pyrophosphoryl-undecaprenol N-acetylglucosamine transferase (EC 2.4.1.227)|nr:undecaprenyldiphospho-muramoylpentapeptide beta-N-acetylglucosaminyltransferase [Betaproteobacteria bacterium]